MSFDSYISYITSDPVIALFVTAKTKDFSELMYNTKMEFRARYGINKNEIENLVHSSDDGMEFYLQRNLFFS